MADYKTRLTADTSQHDQALKKSAQQVYQYKKKTEEAKVTLGKLAGKFGPLAAQIGIAGGAFAALKKTITSTEAGSDAMARTMETAKTSVNHFFKAISTGSFDSFINGLGDIVSTAKEAYNALDNLGTMKMWNNMRQNQLRALIAEDRVIVNNPNSSASERKKAQQRIELNMAKIEALTGDLIKGTEEAVDAVLKKIAGSQHSVYQLRNYMEMRENGTLEEEMRKYKERMSKTTTTTSTSINRHTGPMTYTSTQTVWNNEYARESYEAMQRIYNATDEEINEWVALQNEISALRTNVAMEQAKADKLTNKTVKEVGTTGKAEEVIPEGSIAALEKRLEELKQKFRMAISDEEREQWNREIVNLQAEIDRLNGKKIEVEVLPQEGSIADIQNKIAALKKRYEETADGEIRIKIKIEIEKLEKELEKINTEGATEGVKTFNDLLEEMQKQTQDTVTMVDSLGECFSNLGTCFSDTTGQIISGIGSIISGVSTVIPKVAALIAAEEGEAMASGLAGAAKVEPFPAKVAAIAAIVAQIFGIIGTIASIAKFADGGIIGGATSIGDYNLARVNSGEMILNNRQQQKLFNMLNNPTISTTSTDNGNVTFTIHGSDLQGTLSNYNKRVNRVK